MVMKMLDREEAKRRGNNQPKLKTTHPIAAIEKRILDSVAYADLRLHGRQVDAIE
jgi:hypothetical protein